MTTRNGPIMGAFVALVLAFVAAPLFCAIRDTGTRRLVVVLDLTNLDLERGSGYLDDQREALGEEVAEQKRAMSLEGEVEVSTVVVDANGSDESPGRLAPLKTTSWAKARDAVLGGWCSLGGSGGWLGWCAWL